LAVAVFVPVEVEVEVKLAVTVGVRDAVCVAVAVAVRVAVAVGVSVGVRLGLISIPAGLSEAFLARAEPTDDQPQMPAATNAMPTRLMTHNQADERFFRSGRVGSGSICARSTCSGASTAAAASGWIIAAWGVTSAGVTGWACSSLFFAQSNALSAFGLPGASARAFSAYSRLALGVARAERINHGSSNSGARLAASPARVRARVRSFARSAR